MTKDIQRPLHNAYPEVVLASLEFPDNAGYQMLHALIIGLDLKIECGYIAKQEAFKIFDDVFENFVDIKITNNCINEIFAMGDV